MVTLDVGIRRDFRSTVRSMAVVRLTRSVAASEQRRAALRVAPLLALENSVLQATIPAPLAPPAARPTRFPKSATPMVSDMVVRWTNIANVSLII